MGEEIASLLSRSKPLGATFRVGTPSHVQARRAVALGALLRWRCCYRPVVTPTMSIVPFALATGTLSRGGRGRARSFCHTTFASPSSFTTAARRIRRARTRRRVPSGAGVERAAGVGKSAGRSTVFNCMKPPTYTSIWYGSKSPWERRSEDRPAPARRHRPGPAGALRSSPEQVAIAGWPLRRRHAAGGPWDSNSTIWKNPGSSPTPVPSLRTKAFPRVIDLRRDQVPAVDRRERRKARAHRVRG